MSRLPRSPIPRFEHLEAKPFLDAASDDGVVSSWGVRTRHAKIYECPASGVRFRPPASAEDIEAFYGAEYHDQMTGEDEVRTSAYRLENEDRIRVLQQYCPSGRVLDIGCSKGLLAGQLAAAGYEVYGSDISEFACQATAGVLGEDRVFHGQLSDFVTELEGSLDAITLMDVIEHFDDVVAPLKDMLRMLKPGGVLFLRTPTLSSPFYAVADWSYWLTRGRFKEAVLKAYHAEHFYFFSEDGMRALLEDVGFEVLAVEPDPLLWKNFRTAEMRQGPLGNLALAMIYFAGRAFNRGHGMKVVARRPL